MEGRRSKVKKESIANQGEGLHLYIGHVPHADFPTSRGRRIPNIARTLEGDVKQQLASQDLWSQVFEVTIDALVLALEHHEPGGPGMAHRQVAKGLKGGHKVQVIDPRQGRAFDSKQNLPLNSGGYLLADGFFGDPIQQNFQMGKPSQLAQVWIVSTEAPESINSNQEINASTAAVFFTKADALRFIKNVQTYSATPDMQRILSIPALTLTQQDKSFEEMMSSIGNTVQKLSNELANHETSRTTAIRINQIHALAQEIYITNFHGAKAESFDLQEADIQNINQQLVELTNALKNYLILFASNHPPQTPGKDQTPLQHYDELLLASLTSLSNLAYQKIEQNQDDLFLSRGEESGSEMDRSPISSPSTKLKHDEVRVASSGFFTPPLKRHATVEEKASNQSKEGKGKEKEGREKGESSDEEVGWRSPRMGTSQKED